MKTKFLMTFTAVLMFTATIASAAPITQWNYSIEGIFTSYSNNVGTGTAEITASNPQTLYYEYEAGSATPDSSDTGPTFLKWGDPAYGRPYYATGQSSLQILDIEANMGASVTTDGLAVNGLSFVHNNQPVYEETLAAGSVRAVLSITPQDGVLLGPFSTVLDFSFIETSNDANPQNNPSNSDIFILNEGSISRTVEDFLLYDGIIYTLDFNSNIPELTGLTGIYEQYNGKLGWRTTEAASTTIQTLFSITSRPAPVPEPSTVLLLGAGLLGLGAITRRRP